MISIMSPQLVYSWTIPVQNQFHCGINEQYLTCCVAHGWCRIIYRHIISFPSHDLIEKTDVKLHFCFPLQYLTEEHSTRFKKEKAITIQLLTIEMNQFLCEIDIFFIIFTFSEHYTWSLSCQSCHWSLSKKLWLLDVLRGRRKKPVAFRTSSWERIVEKEATFWCISFSLLITFL